jgi:peptidoglycan pentaglycine glycine transferase (the first glycine)
MAIVEITDKDKWDALHQANRIRSGDFLHSWHWGEFQHSLGRKVMRFSDGTSLAQVIELPLPFGKKYWYCPKGPISINPKFIDELAGLAKAAGAMFLRVEPQGPHPTLSQVGRGAGGEGLRQVHSIQPRCTSIVDLAKSEDELMRAMHEKTRYNIRLAERHGVTVERYIDDAKTFDELYDLFATTARRDRFHLHEKSYYAAQLKVFAEQIITFIARYQGKMVAVAIVMFSGDTATYLHGASSSEHRNVMAPHALHWAIMKCAKEQGYRCYDLWGISTGDEPSWEGITRFKTGFGGETVCAPGTFDLILDGFWYSIYALAKRFI